MKLASAHWRGTSGLGLIAVLLPVFVLAGCPSLPRKPAYIRIIESIKDFIHSRKQSGFVSQA